MSQRVRSFALEPGRILARKYEVMERLGGGWEGEVYKVCELGTRIERAAKFFIHNAIHATERSASTPVNITNSGTARSSFNITH